MKALFDAACARLAEPSLAEPFLDRAVAALDRLDARADARESLFVILAQMQAEVNRQRALNDEMRELVERLEALLVSRSCTECGNGSDARRGGKA